MRQLLVGPPPTGWRRAPCCGLPARRRAIDAGRQGLARAIKNPRFGTNLARAACGGQTLRQIGPNRSVLPDPAKGLPDERI